jgi:valyl-tRNA synthetase
VSESFNLSKTYQPSLFEKKIYVQWVESNVFHAIPDGRDNTYVIMMPLPNVTGALHMGHAMDNVMQDMLIRWHRMLGDNTLWMPGTDHAGIATQAVVEKRLQELEGLTRHDIGRKALIERIWQWKDQFQTRIVSQQQRMGCSADWQRQRFTMDAICTRAVRHTFYRMFEDGLIFRGQRLVNWDPFLQTSISDDEVYHKTVAGHFWHVRYPLIDPQDGEPDYIQVATTRPETMLGDTAVAVHPDPEQAFERELARLYDQQKKTPGKNIEKEIQQLNEQRAKRLPALLQWRDLAKNGRQVNLPLMNRPIPLILDEWAKPHLGSGCVKITPAHDPNDHEVWTRHAKEIDCINILNPDGTLNAAAGAYENLDRFTARKKVVADLDALGLLGEVEERQIEVGHSDRSKTPIEPYLSNQWFVRMGDVPGGVLMAKGTPHEHTRAGLAQAAIDAVEEGRVRFHPNRFTKTYLDWLKEKRDWPISRQLWWGHRIPVWTKTAGHQDAGCQIEQLFAAVLTDSNVKACVRLTPEGEGKALLVKRPNAVPNLAEGTWSIDVCLLGENQRTRNDLERIGFVQDPDVLDTWFSSALWPQSTLGWPDPESADPEGGAPLSQTGSKNCLDTFYPGSCLVTARDIITLWVARMVLAGEYNLGKVPFSDVFIHANILDGHGERMSKSKGNGIDPVDIIDTYGTDAMRYILCDMQTGSQDIRLPVTAVCPGCQAKQELIKLKHGQSVFTYLCGQCQTEFDVLGTMPDLPAAKLSSDRFLDGSKFCNKLWNTARFAFEHLEAASCAPLKIEQLALEDRWILAALNRAIKAVDRSLSEYNPSAAIGAARDFMWGELCDWYLELIKPRLADPKNPGAAVARQVLAHCFDQTLRLLHPFIPYITEHLYQQLHQRLPQRGLPGLTGEEQTTDLLVSAAWPQPAQALDDPDLLATFADLQATTSGIRELRSSKGISPKQTVDVTVRPKPNRVAKLSAQAHVVKHMANISKLIVDAQATQPAGSISLVVADLQIFVHDLVNEEEEKQRLEMELRRIEKEISICQKKLSTPGFVSKAPKQVVEEQKKRLAKYQAQKEAVQRTQAELG